jgi:hypothetical protein
MIHVTIQVDPLIYSSLGEIATLKKSGSRAQLIRDALYTAVWNAQRGGGHSRHALDCPKGVENQSYRLKHGKVVEVDAWGLEINDELRTDLAACQRPDITAGEET